MQIRWTPTAQSDLIQVFEYIAEDRPKAALNVIDRIESGTNNLATYPEMGRPGRVTSTPELVIPGTPFIVVYRVQPNWVDILAILHDARKWPEGF